MSEGEDVFYTYRASVSSSKDGEDASLQLVSLFISQALDFSASLFKLTFSIRIGFIVIYYTAKQ